MLGAGLRLDATRDAFEYDRERQIESICSTTIDWNAMRRSTDVK